MMTDINTLLVTVRDIMKSIKKNEENGSLVKAFEVGPKSFVQIMEAVPLVPGMLEPVTWQYHQFWVDKASEIMQEKLIGTYLNERLGKVKIIGIFDSVEEK